MTIIRVTTVTLTIVVFVAIVVSVATGDFSEEGAWILANPWGRMSLFDLYAGIALFTGWVIIREERLWIAILWIPVFIVLGNAATALYAAIAALRTDNARAFLLGARVGHAADS